MIEIAEEWRPIPEWDGLYEASSLGRVKSLPRTVRRRNRWGGENVCHYGERILSPSDNAKGDGYLILQLSDDSGRHTHSVHTLVCAAFHGPRPDGMQAAHGNGRRHENFPNNLRWATPVDNEADKIAHGRKNNGARNGMAKLTLRQVQSIRQSMARGARSREVAQIFGVSPSQIDAIHARRKWKHVA